MKNCPKCKTVKSLDCFGIARARKDGLSCWCKECSRSSVNLLRSSPDGAKKHRDRERERARANIIESRNKSLRWRNENLERAKKACSDAGKKRRKCPVWRAWERVRQNEWYLKNPAKGVAKTRRRQASELKSTPTWLTAIHMAQIQEIYDISKALEIQTGVKYHVDHIHPLRGKGFVGLHVPWNLRVLEASKNCSKGNNLPFEDLHIAWR